MDLVKGEKFYEYRNFFKNYYAFLKEHLDSKKQIKPRKHRDDWHQDL